MKLTRWLVILLGRVSLLLGTCALLCSLGTVALAAPAANGYVRVVHAAPGAGNVDVFVDGKSVLSNFAFSTISSYMPVPAGAHIVKIAPAGKGVAAAVITQNVAVTAGTPYTLAAIGTARNGFSLTEFVDNNQTTAGRARVRVYHLSPNTGPVNVASGGRTVVTGLNYSNASNYLTLTPGAYTFNVTATRPNTTEAIPATLGTGTVSSIFALGLYRGTPALKFMLASVPAVVPAMNAGHR